MRWSVGIEAEAGPGAVPRGGGRACRRGRRQRRHRLGDRVDTLRRHGWSCTPTAGTRRWARRRRSSPGPSPRPGCRCGRSSGSRRSPSTKRRTGSRGSVIRLGSLAGYPFEGPAAARRLDPAVPPGRLRDHVQARAGHQAGQLRGHLRRSLRRPLRRALPVPHPRAHCWVRRAGSRWKVYVCTYEVPGGSRPHREQIARELIAIYQPSCNKPAIRPVVAGRMDRRVPGADHRSRGQARPGRLAAALGRIPPAPWPATAIIATCRSLTRGSRGQADELPVQVTGGGRSRPRRAGGSGGGRRRGGRARVARAARAAG